MGLISRLFWKGLIVVMPITLTIYLLVIILVKAETVFGQMLKGMIGPDLYIPGSGLFLTFVTMIAVGVLVNNLITGKIINFFINQFERMPFIKAIYSPLRDLISLFGGDGPENMKKVVLVKLDKIGIECIGLVTREEFSDLPEGSIGSEKIAVYIPMSYMLGGFTTIVDRDQVTPVDIPVEKAIKLAITGWIKAEKNPLS